MIIFLLFLGLIRIKNNFFYCKFRLFRFRVLVCIFHIGLLVYNFFLACCGGCFCSMHDCLPVKCSLMCFRNQSCARSSQYPITSLDLLCSNISLIKFHEFLFRNFYHPCCSMMTTADQISPPSITTIFATPKITSDSQHAAIQHLPCCWTLESTATVALWMLDWEYARRLWYGSYLLSWIVGFVWWKEIHTRDRSCYRVWDVLSGQWSELLSTLQRCPKNSVFPKMYREVVIVFERMVSILMITVDLLLTHLWIVLRH